MWRGLCSRPSGQHNPLPIRRRHVVERRRWSRRQVIWTARLVIGEGKVIAAKAMDASRHGLRLCLDADAHASTTIRHGESCAVEIHVPDSEARCFGPHQSVLSPAHAPRSLPHRLATHRHRPGTAPPRNESRPARSRVRSEKSRFVSWWRLEELNLRHGAYETPALPLSYTAGWPGRPRSERSVPHDADTQKRRKMGAAVPRTLCYNPHGQSEGAGPATQAARFGGLFNAVPATPLARRSHAPPRRTRRR